MMDAYSENAWMSFHIAETLDRDALPDFAQLDRWSQKIITGIKQYAPSAYKADSGLINVRIVDRAEGFALNKRYRNLAYATNVLAFPWEAEPTLDALDDLPDHLPLGDIAICWPKVLEEAAELHLSTDWHFRHLLIHGVLHLLGYDHQKAVDAKAMRALEDRLLL